VPTDAIVPGSTSAAESVSGARVALGKPVYGARWRDIEGHRMTALTVYPSARWTRCLAHVSSLIHITDPSSILESTRPPIDDRFLPASTTGKPTGSPDQSGMDAPKEQSGANPLEVQKSGSCTIKELRLRVSRGASFVAVSAAFAPALARAIGSPRGPLPRGSVASRRMV
jgi:hypothetical protein